MKPILIVLLALTGILFSHCKEKALGVAYVVGDRLPVYAKPDRFLQPTAVLPRDTRFDILETKIPDPRAPKRAFWYRIRSGKVEGYFSYDEELVRKNVASFQPVGGPQDALVVVSSLRLRSNPSLSAKVLTSMPRRTVLNVLMEGSLRQKIGKTEDTWVKVRTPDGKEGFSFAGFLQRGNPEEIKRLAEAEFELIQGFVYAKTERPVYLREPGGRPVTKEDPVTGDMHDLSRYPRVGENARRYAVVTARQKHEDVYWYHVNQTECNIMECYGLNAWVSGKDVQFLTDFFEHTIANSGRERNVPLLREVQAGLKEGEVLHAGKTEYKEIVLVQGDATTNPDGGVGGKDPGEAPETKPDPETKVAAQPVAHSTPGAIPTATEATEPIRHYLVEASLGTGSETRHMLVAATGNRYRSLGSFSYPELRDLDGDGHLELISNESERADTTFSIYSYAGPQQGFQKLFQFSSFDPVEFSDPYIVFYFHNEENGLDTSAPPFQKKFAKASKRVVLLENGKYREIAFSEMPEEKRGALKFKRD